MRRGPPSNHICHEGSWASRGRRPAGDLGRPACAQDGILLAERAQRLWPAYHHLQAFHAVAFTRNLAVYVRAHGCRRPRARGALVGQNPPEDPSHGDKPEKTGTRPRAIGRTKSGLNSKLHMVSDGTGRPLSLFLSPDRMSDARGALVLLAETPPAGRQGLRCGLIARVACGIQH
jgi:hypothetical protein